MRWTEGRKLRYPQSLQNFLSKLKHSPVILIAEFDIGSSGRFSNLLKQPRKELEVAKEEVKGFTHSADLKRLSKEKDDLIDELKQKILNFANERLELIDDRSKLARLYDMGLIDSAGEPILVEPPDDPDVMK